MSLLERNGPKKAEHFVVRYAYPTEEFEATNEHTKSLCGSQRAVKPEHVAGMVTELARAMFERGYQQAQEDIRKAIGMFP